MCSEYLKKYADHIMVYERLYHAKTNESVEDLLKLISSILVTKYKIPFQTIVVSILKAIQFNYRSITLYIQLLKGAL